MRPHQDLGLAGLLGCVGLALWCAPSIGCLGDLEPEVGPLLGDGCVNEDSESGTAVAFAEDLQQDIFDRSRAGCVGCHDPSRPTGVGVRLGGLELTSHATLVRGGANSADEIVVPGRPCSSVLYRKLTDAPPFGSRMPADGPPFLNSLELARVHDWIAEGGHAE